MTVDDQIDAVRRYAADARLLTTERDKAVLKAHQLGAGYAVIAAAAKMTRQGIVKIVRRMLDNSVVREHN